MAVRPTRPDRPGAHDAAPGDPSASDPTTIGAATAARIRSAQRTALVAGGLVVVTVLAAAVAGPFVPGQRPGAEFDLPTALLPDRNQPTPAPTGDAVADVVPENGMPAWLVVIGFFVVLALLTFLGRQAVRVVRRWLEQQRELGFEEGFTAGTLLRGDVLDLAQPALAAGVEDAFDALARDLPPGDAVIAAWVALEQSAERSGVVRERAQTATEFTLDLLDTTRADPAASRTLLDLYLAARFSEHPVTDDDVTRARAALHDIARGLRRRTDPESDEGAS
ncbi:MULTISPECIES: DUF4129 domain-containing protein [Cellulomonas]|uniref:Protein-glutamine gamma-glutamyltransferase-like C-terminal domain-containing protein n=1 Tax=Cellulomonas gelida TaxID=1712 RepID=A0A4Y3KMU9_9CELL|nr:MULTISPECIES: DUF4129 domain-containing protein [Cellulomonas]MCR6705018.1 DUF4129 domain-containing protein [Cellulomonas sp.]GEA85741.1 hypothetical protein CGE01nite_29920 [Cellulomonas gelida]GGL39383.1 hypothetical protein GCM10009774_32610 [Cellulomonas gelida]